MIDGEAVLGIDGVADFNALHSRKPDHEVQFYTVDIRALDGDVLHLSMHKTNLARLLTRRPDGIFCRAIRAARDRPRPVQGRVRRRGSRARREIFWNADGTTSALVRPF